jgi:hypothetical protein
MKENRMKKYRGRQNNQKLKTRVIGPGACLFMVKGSPNKHEALINIDNRKKKRTSQYFFLAEENGFFTFHPQPACVFQFT